MTEPSQYFKGRTVQEQMDEVIGYVDKRAEEVAAAKAGAVLQPAEEAKTAAQAAAAAAEAAKDTTLAALPTIQQDISGLKAEDTAIENKNTQQDTAIAALQTADNKNVKIDNINQYAVGLTGNQDIYGIKDFKNNIVADAFIVNHTQDSRVPSNNKVFQIEVDSIDGYTHYVAFNNGADGSRSINIVMYVSENDVAYFNLTYTAQGEKKIFTNFQKPDGW